MPDKIEGKPRSLWELECAGHPRLHDDNEWRPVAGFGFTDPARYGFIMGPARRYVGVFRSPALEDPVLRDEDSRLQRIDAYFDQPGIKEYLIQVKCGNSQIDLTSFQRSSGNDVDKIYYSGCDAYLTGLSKQTLGNELEQFHFLTVQSPVTIFLAHHHGDSDEKLGEIVDALLDFNRPDELRVWLDQNLDHWLAHRVAALAAVIEAAVRLSPQALDGNTLYQVLGYKHPHPLVVSVAAQRVRLLHLKSRDLRGKIWNAVKRWIDLWAQDSNMQEYAVMALPSVPYVAGKEAVSWLSQFIANGPDRIAWGAALAALDWASGNCTETEPVDEDSARALSDAIMDRLRNERMRSSREAGSWAELVPTLVWVLGATAAAAQLPQVAQVLAEAFERANGIEDAAAVRAGKMLVRQLRDEASRALIDAFGASSPLFVRFWTAIAV